MANDANITLRIDAEEGKATKGLLTLEQAERKLEVAVKAGNSTLKLRANTEAELAKILPAIAAAEGKAVTATQKRAAANLAAQKSAALLKQATELQIDADKRARIAQMGKETMRSAAALAEDNDFKRAQRRLAEINSQTERSGGLLGRSGAGAAAFGAKLAAGAAAAKLLGMAMDEIAAAQDRALEKAQRSDTLANGMKDLVMALPGGAEGEAALRKITKIGAENGMAADATAAMAAPIYATADKSGDGKLNAAEQAAFDANLKAGAALGSTGVSANDATNIILAGDNKGVGGQDTAAKLLTAATISKRGPAEFSRSASAISQFDDLNTGMAVTTALSAAELNPERLAERTKDAQLALSSAADKSNFSKKYGLAGLSQGEKIAKLRRDALASGDVKRFTDQFQNVAGLDEGKAGSLAMLVQQGELFGNAEKSIRASSSKDLAPAIKKLKDNPLTGSAMRSAEAAASSANADAFGAESDAARETRAAALARGAELRRYGGDRAVNPDGTEKTFSFNPLNILGEQNRDIVGGRWNAMWNGMPGTGFNGNGPNQNMKMSGFEKLEVQLEALNKTLAQNNAITAANTASAKSTKPVGGAASNAEEKY